MRECADCGKSRGHYFIIDGELVCDSCKAERQRKEIRSGAEVPAVHIFQPRWFEHLGPKPLYFESKRKLVDTCRRRGLVATGFMDGE